MLKSKLYELEVRKRRMRKKLEDSRPTSLGPSDTLVRAGPSRIKICGPTTSRNTQRSSTAISTTSLRRVEAGREEGTGMPLTPLTATALPAAGELSRLVDDTWARIASASMAIGQWALPCSRRTGRWSTARVLALRAADAPRALSSFTATHARTGRRDCGRCSRERRVLDRRRHEARFGGRALGIAKRVARAAWETSRRCASGVTRYASARERAASPRRLTRSRSEPRTASSFLP